MLAMQMAGAQLAAMVQHRPALGLCIDGPSQGHFYVDFETGKLVRSKPPTSTAAHACFIQSIKTISSTRADHGSVVREARLFKYAPAPAPILQAAR